MRVVAMSTVVDDSNGDDDDDGAAADVVPTPFTVPPTLLAVANPIWLLPISKTRYAVRRTESPMRIILLEEDDDDVW